MVSKNKVKEVKRLRRNFFVVIALVFVFFVVLIFSVAIKKVSYDSYGSGLEGEEVSFLYVQNAESGSLIKSSEGTWTLTLNGVSPNTIYFSDRPARETGQEPTADFVNNWAVGEDSFAEIPPNAALDVFGSDGEQHVLVLELLDASYDSETRILSYDVVILNRDLDDPTLFSGFADAALFIDSTYKSYNCKCDIPSGGSCSCEYHYKLGHGETKEFRVSCHGDDGGTTIHITERKDTTTCTFATSYSLGYVTKSCTNWHTSKHDDLKIRIECEEFEETNDYDG